MNFFSYWNSDKMVLSMHHAVEVDARSAPEFTRSSRELAARAGLPMPKTYLIDSPQPNAFATGRNPQNAAVAATTGLLERLSREEIAGVMAHELAHVEHRDTLTMTITATLAGAISMLGNFAFFFGGNRDNNNPLGIVGVLVAMIVAPIAAMLVQMAISRTREYSADRRGAEICGQPLWLASALDKIARTAGRIPNPDAERNPATAHIFIINPLSGHAWTICSPPTRAPATASRRWRSMARRIRGTRWRARQPDEELPRAPGRRRRCEPRRTLGPQSDRTPGPVVVTARPLPAAGERKRPAVGQNRSPGLAARRRRQSCSARRSMRRRSRPDRMKPVFPIPGARPTRPRAGPRNPGHRAALSRHDLATARGPRAAAAAQRAAAARTPCMSPRHRSCSSTFPTAPRSISP